MSLSLRILREASHLYIHQGTFKENALPHQEQHSPARRLLTHTIVLLGDGSKRRYDTGRAPVPHAHEALAIRVRDGFSLALSVYHMMGAHTLALHPRMPATDISPSTPTIECS
jgi:hypothetical protein